MKKKKGFTLVELLAVIVILAVILVIAVPKIMDTIKNSKEGTLMSSAKLIAGQAEKKYIENQVLGITDKIECDDVAKTTDDYASCNILFDSDGKAKVTIAGSGKFEGMFVCGATKTEASISSGCYTDSACFAYEELRVIDSFEINVDNCELFLSNLDWGMSADEITSVCAGGEDSYGGTLIDYPNYGDFTVEDLEAAGAVSDVTYHEGLEITNYDIWCGGQDVSVPSKIEGMEVIGIGYEAFEYSSGEPGEEAYNNKNNGYKTSLLSNNLYNAKVMPIGQAYLLKSVSLPSTIEYISGYAFAGNELTSIDLSGLTKLKEIGSRAFERNQLTSVKLPSSISGIYDYAFANNYTRMNVNFSDLTNLVYIGLQTFANNEITGELDFSNLTKLQEIQERAFQHNKITSVKLPSSVTYIGERAFENVGDNLLTFVHLENTTNVEIGCSAFGEPSEIETHNLPNSYAACPKPN